MSTNKHENLNFDARYLLTATQGNGMAAAMENQPTQHALLHCPAPAKRALQWAIMLFPFWGLTWLAAWLAIQRVTMAGPVIPILVARTLTGSLFALLPIKFGVQGLRELKRHSGYTTGLLRSTLGIAIGAAFLVVEFLTILLTLSLMIQRNAAM